MTAQDAARERWLAEVRERAAAESPDDPTVPQIAALLAQIRLDQAQDSGQAEDRRAAS